MLVGGALAFGQTGQFAVIWWLISLAGIYALEIAKNAINEFVDYQSGVDPAIPPEQRNPFSGGKKTIVDGLLSVREAQLIGLLTLSAGVGIGLLIVWLREPRILWIGMLGVFLAVFYSLPPFKLNYRGLGEFAVGLTFGPLITAGVYLVLTNSLPPLAWLAGIPIGFLIANVLWINQFPDYEADRQGGKRTLVVQMGRQRAVAVFAGLFAAAFVSAGLLAILDRNPFWLLAWLGAPAARLAVQVAARHHDDIPNLLTANGKTITVYQLTGLGMLLAAASTRLI